MPRHRVDNAKLTCPEEHEAFRGEFIQPTIRGPPATLFDVQKILKNGFRRHACRKDEGVGASGGLKRDRRSFGKALRRHQERRALASPSPDWAAATRA